MKPVSEQFQTSHKQSLRLMEIYLLFTYIKIYKGVHSQAGLKVDAEVPQNILNPQLL